MCSMEIAKVVKCLNSKTRRNIMRILLQGDKTPIEIYNSLGKEGPRYRQSINKALEILTDAKLVKKYYDNDTKKIKYGIINQKIIIDFLKMEVEPIDKVNL